MSLTDHGYFFVSERNEFYKVNKDTFELIKNSVIEQVYAVWDCIGNKWFDDAPMLVKTSAGILSVNVQSDINIAIGWNDISLSEKPKWFDETQNAQINGLNWVEDLEWREYTKVHQICNEQIESVLFHPYSGKWGIGIGLKCKSGKCLWIYDAGDVISAKIDHPLSADRTAAQDPLLLQAAGIAEAAVNPTKILINNDPATE